MADPSIDPALARPSQEHHQPHGVPSSDIFNTSFDTGPDPSTYQLAAAALQGVKSNSAAAATATSGDEAGKKGNKSKRVGPLIRKRSGWNAFYKEQFAIYHANNPPAVKQNARERKGFSAYAAAMWKQLSPAQKEAYVQRAGEDDALAVSRPVEKLRRKRAGLLDTLGRIVAELETEFGVESLVFWSERDVPTTADGIPSPLTEGEVYGIVGSTSGVHYIETLRSHQLAPEQFAQFVHQSQPADADDANQNLLIGSRKRKESTTLEPSLSNDLGISTDDIDPATGQLRKKSKSNISRDYHDAEFRRLLLALLNNNLPPQGQKTRLPRGFFGPYLEKQGLELVGLPEKPVEIGESGKIGGWSADALRRNLDAVRNNRVYIRRIDLADATGPVELAELDDQETIIPEAPSGGNQEQEAARILAESAGGNRRGRRSANK